MKNFTALLKKEWHKISWPKDIHKQTIMVIAASVITGAVIAVIDHMGQGLVNFLFSL